MTVLLTAATTHGSTGEIAQADALDQTSAR